MNFKRRVEISLIVILAMVFLGSCKEEELYTIEEYTKLTCKFNNKEISNGQSLTAYSAESLVYNAKCSSVAETRICNDGELSGSFEFDSCEELPPADCTFEFDNSTVLHGSYIQPVYQLSSVPFGQYCSNIQEIRTCDNGTLTGSFLYPSCVELPPNDCEFNGVTIAHDNTTLAYSKSVSDWPETCSLIERTMTCSNGGFDVDVNIFQYSSCVDDQPDNCSAEDYGQFVAHNTSEQFWQTATVSYGSSCQSQDRFCSNGSLSGTYTFASCSVSEPSVCNFSDGGFAAHDPNTFLTLYNTDASDWPATCESHVSSSVVCNNGSFSPDLLSAYSYQSCDNGTPQSCSLNTPGGGSSTIAHDAIVMAYSAQSVIFGTDGGCDSVKVEAKCYDSDFVDPNDINNVLFSSATYYDDCSIGEPSGCTLVGLNGATMNFSHDENGETAIPGFTTNLEPFVDDNTVCPASVDLFCYNGALKLEDGTLNTVGGYTYGACQVAAPGGCSWFGDSYNHGDTVTAYEFNNSADGLCSSTEERTCNNGTWTGSFAYDNCLQESILVGARFNANSGGIEFTTIPLDINGDYYQEKQGTYDNSNGSSVKIGISEVQGSISYGGSSYSINFSGGVSDTVVGNSDTVAVAVVIDSSASMNDNDPQSLRYDAVKSLIDAIPFNTYLQMTDFDNYANESPWFFDALIENSDDKTTAKNSIPNYVGGATPLYRSMHTTVGAMQTRNRNLVVTLCDGEDTAGGKTPSQVISLADGIPAEIHNIGLGSAINLEFKTMPNDADAGGSYRNVQDAANLAELFENLGKTTSIGYAKTTGVPSGLTLQAGETYSVTITVRGISQTVEFVR